MMILQDRIAQLFQIAPTLYYHINIMNTLTLKVVPQNNPPQHPVSQQNDINRSQISIDSSPIKKTHLSQSIKKSIAYAVQQHHQQQQHISKIKREESELTKMVRSKIKQLRRISVCEICNCQFKRAEVHICDCQHKYSFCQPCLYAYAMYKIKQFQEIYCPYQNCGITIDIESKFFKKMPVNMQNTYHKIHRFTLAAKDTSVVKLCPHQQCQGMLRLNQQGQGLICDTCSKQYCVKCYLAKHEGDCEQYQLNYFQNNLHYRQCRRCKMIVQRNKGCNHMTCRCLHQFCYICGQKWTARHAKLHQQHETQQRPGQPRIHHQSFMLQIVECCICAECQQGACLHFWNSNVGIITKFMLKLILLLIQGLRLVIQLMFRDVPFLVWILLCTLIIGMFFTSIQIICQSDCLQCVLLVLFFPVAMLMGAYRSLCEIFYPAMQQLYADVITPIMDGLNDIISL